MIQVLELSFEELNGFFKLASKITPKFNHETPCFLDNECQINDNSLDCLDGELKRKIIKEIVANIQSTKVFNTFRKNFYFKSALCEFDTLYLENTSQLDDVRPCKEIWLMSIIVIQMMSYICIRGKLFKNPDKREIIKISKSAKDVLDFTEKYGLPLERENIYTAKYTLNKIIDSLEPLIEKPFQGHDPLVAQILTKDKKIRKKKAEYMFVQKICEFYYCQYRSIDFNIICNLANISLNKIGDQTIKGWIKDITSRPPFKTRNFNEDFYGEDDS